jgi:hypothetical protein
MTNQPLLLLSTQRIQQEMERARGMGAAARYELVRHRWLLAACLVQFVAGLTLMVLGYHVTGEDVGQALFLGGLLIGYLGPVWTWILANWHGAD